MALFAPKKKPVDYGAILSSSTYGLNLPPKAPTPTVTTPPPTTTTPPPTTTTTPTYTNSYLDTLKRLSQESASRSTTQAEESAKMLKDSYERQNARTSTLAPTYQQNFDKFKTNVNAGITEQEARAKEDEASTRETYGEALRRSAQANREVNQGIQGTFAGLGTLDSSAFQQQTLNQGNRFVAGQQSTMKQQAKDISGIQRSLGDYRREAQLAVDQEEQTLNAKLVEIANTLDKNSVEYETAVRKVYAEAMDKVSAIEAGLTQAEYEVAKAGQGTNLSESFIKTGVPETKEDFMYRTQNPDAFEGKLGGNMQAGQEKQALVDVIDKLAGGDVGAITGVLRTGWIPGTQGALTKNYYDQLKGMLSLENRAKLKGSGAISDFESKTLDRAASALGQNLSEDQFRAVLNDLKSNLGGGQSSQGGQIRVQSPDGQTGTIDASELQSAIASGWRQV